MLRPGAMWSECWTLTKISRTEKVLMLFRAVAGTEWHFVNVKTLNKTGSNRYQWNNKVKIKRNDENRARGNRTSSVSMWTEWRKISDTTDRKMEQEQVSRLMIMMIRISPVQITRAPGGTIMWVRLSMTLTADVMLRYRLLHVCSYSSDFVNVQDLGLILEICRNYSGNM